MHKERFFTHPLIIIFMCASKTVILSNKEAMVKSNIWYNIKIKKAYKIKNI